jgi:hypothetical protein
MPASTPDAAADLDAGIVAANSGDASKAALCASSFGDALTAPYGRLDGTVVAIVTPADQQCAMPNSDHVIVQVLAGGKVYRMVVNVLSTKADPDVRFFQGPGPTMPGMAFEEGWHTGVALDYVADLGKHNADFAPKAMAPLVAAVSDAIPLGSKISVFGASSGGAYAHSAHKVHRNGRRDDGAIILQPDTKAPTYLLFHFAEQMF